MKISIYALHLGFGGVEKYVITLANMLSEQHDVEIVSTYRIQEEPAFDVRPEVKIRYLLTGVNPNKNKEELRRAVKDRNIAAGLREGIKSVRILWLRRSRNAADLKQCDSDVVISTRVFHNRLIARYARPGIVRITGEHNHHNNNQKYIRSVIQSCRGFDYFIPISGELCDFYRESMEKQGVETRYIRFCIDKNPDRAVPALDGKNLISVGRLSHEKGVEDLIRLFERIHRENQNVTLHIVGDGDERDRMSRMIEEKGLSGSVVLHGFREKEYIYGLMKEMSLYVMTSYTESFGIVLLEAMSCGIPCVAYSSAQGAHEIIQDGRNGWLIDGRDEEKMKEKILSLLSDREELLRLSGNAIATAEEFSYDNTKRAWLSLMDEIESKRENRK
ncbi:glycosyltransferase [Ruminococcus sp. CLA-AA-H200]|uniref:Glycosyltransferase n=1 Tax=Ruminococcus turbiniformis TaxID=2881258 RepID=A0ABS8FVZ9_9FIRM|nr:glycosyltransferase [Ruminococcus turbiniformis]MCC2254132.1 glycosyltransferase [Ruminococcus turbiniformis]